MGNWQPIYKATIYEHGAHRSLAVSNLAPWGQEYVPGKIIRPKIEHSKLFVTSDFPEWAKSAGPIVVIWRGRGLNPVPSRYARPGQDWRQFWREHKANPARFAIEQDTLFVDAVILDEAVWAGDAVPKESLAIRQIQVSA